MRQIDCVRRVAVLGLGTMGHGIAQTFALAGYEVACFDESTRARNSLCQRVGDNLAAFVSGGLIDREAVEPTLAATRHRHARGGAQRRSICHRGDSRRPRAEQAMLAQIEQITSPGTILASNSSSFPISLESGCLLRRPERAIVTHWFNRPHLTPVVEVVPGPKTSDVVTATTTRLLNDIGKQPIRLRHELPGFPAEPHPGCDSARGLGPARPWGCEPRRDRRGHSRDDRLSLRRPWTTRGLRFWRARYSACDVSQSGSPDSW